MDYNININKICRVCLEEGVLTSIFNTEFAMMPAEMIMLCAKIKVYKNDGLPPVICNNCIYRLGAAYHFKQQCENSDLRLRSYLGILDKGFGTRDVETNTDNLLQHKLKDKLLVNDDDDDDDEEEDEEDCEDETVKKLRKCKSRNRYKRKLPEERKKRGPKPQEKVAQTCFECNKTFKCAAQLHLHIRTHTGERPYVCAYCSRRFAQKHNLAIHTRTHTGERPFQCEICSKQFAALGNFQAHKKIHSGVRDQICPVCNKGFITSGDVARHMITHTGIKNHHCDTCGKTFSRNRDMVAHKKKIHLNERSGETWKCRECHKVFATSLSLSTHYRTHEPTTIGPIVTSMPIAPTAICGSSLGIGNIGVGLQPHHSVSQPPQPAPLPPSAGLTGMLTSHHPHPHQSSLGMAMHHHTQRLHHF